MDLEQTGYGLMLLIVAVDAMIIAALPNDPHLSVALAGSDLNQMDISSDISSINLTEIDNENIFLSVPFVGSAISYGQLAVNAFLLLGKVAYNLFFAWSALVLWVFITIGFEAMGWAIVLPIAIIEVYLIYKLAITVVSVLRGGGT